MSVMIVEELEMGIVDMQPWQQDFCVCEGKVRKREEILGCGVEKILNGDSILLALDAESMRAACQSWPCENRANHGQDEYWWEAIRQSVSLQQSTSGSMSGTVYINWPMGR